MARKGKVWLVGAGPGDPGLMTVKGMAVLQAADVVVYDHLVAERLVDQAPDRARRVYVGKVRGRHVMGQEAINRLLVREGRAGRRVVRLKGGDPLLFGRGGEEALALREARVPFDIVPGVTSALAVPAYAGIPVTHRDAASSVAIVTGHENPAKPDSAIQWDRLAAGADTLVCLMGVTRLPAIAARLMRHGRAARTPCAVIEWGTTARQRTVVGTLGTIAGIAAAARIAPPAIVVVGEVVRLRRRLAWFERRPLHGLRVAVTRPADRAESLCALLEALGADTIELPAVQLRAPSDVAPFRDAVRRLGEADWVFFTSPEGIDWFQRLLRPMRRDLRILQGRHIGAIGPKTAAAIRARGIHVDFVPATYSQEGMLAGLARRRLAGRRAVIFCAAGSRDVLIQGLRGLGLRAQRVTIYETIVPSSLSATVRRVWGSKPGRAPAVDVLTVTSASGAQHLAQAFAASGLSRAFRRLAFASIGPVTSQAVRRLGGRVAAEASPSTIEGLVDAMAAMPRSGVPARGRVVQQGGRR
jgi:uroporphyrinogen III methyltransferase/synthase